VAVKIRLKRLGKLRTPHYRIVVADSRTKRDGRVIEEIGRYVPTNDPSIIEVNSDRAQYWLGVGAQPTEQVTALLKLTGDWGTFKGEKGAKNTVEPQKEKEVFQADAKKKPVLRPKAEKPAKVEAAIEEAVEAEVVAEAAEEVAVEAAAEAVVDEAVAEAAAEAGDVVAEAVAEEAAAEAEVVAEAAAEVAEAAEEVAAEAVAEAVEAAAEESAE